MFRKIKFHSMLGNAWLLLLVAVLTAGALTWFVYRYLGEREAHVRAEVTGKLMQRGIEVVVPRRDVAAGTPLSSGDFVSREISADLVYDDMVRVDRFDALRSAKLVRAVLHGRPLRMSDIDALRGRDFSDMLPAGQRALTLEIDAVNSTASMLRPGNRVDMYWVGAQAEPGAGDGKTVRLLLPDVLVLATGQSVKPRDAGDADETKSIGNASRYDTVTMQLPAADAPRVVLAQKMGALRLILRNADDSAAAPPVALTESDVFPAERVAKQVSVEVIAGGGAGAGVANVAQVAQVAQVAPISSASSDAQPRDVKAGAIEPASASLFDSAAAIAKQWQQRDTYRISGQN